LGEAEGLEEMTEQALARLRWADGHANVMNVDVTADRVVVPSPKGSTWFLLTDEIDNEGYVVLVEERQEKK
jgi:hypothetical protein